MTGFYAAFSGTKIFINGEKEYQLGEILTKYLSKNFKGLNDIHFRCKRYMGVLRYPETLEEASGFDRFIQGAISFYNSVEDMLCSLPPYNALKLEKGRLEAILEQYGWLFEDEYDEEDELLGYHNSYEVTHGLDEFDRADMIDEVLEFNSKLKALATEYYLFIDDLMRVRTVYEPFLEEIHSQSRYLDNTETAQAFHDFRSSTLGKMRSYEKLIPSGNMQLSYEVIYKKKCPVLCEQYRFETIGAFCILSCSRAWSSIICRRNVATAVNIFCLRQVFSPTTAHVLSRVWKTRFAVMWDTAKSMPTR